MSEIHVKEGESLDSALKRFKRSCAKAGIVAEVRRRECYESPSVKRRKKSEAARKNRNQRYYYSSKKRRAFPWKARLFVFRLVIRRSTVVGRFVGAGFYPALLSLRGGRKPDVAIRIQSLPCVRGGGNAKR